MQSAVMLLFLNSIGRHIAKKLLRLKNHIYQPMMTVTVTLKYYLGQVKTGKGEKLVYNYVHMVVIM